MKRLSMLAMGIVLLVSPLHGYAASAEEAAWRTSFAGDEGFIVCDDGTEFMNDIAAKAYPEVEAWKDIAAISSCANSVMGLKRDGTVVAVEDNCKGNAACLKMPLESDGEFHDYTLLTADEDTLQGRPTDLSLFVLTKGECCVLFVAKEEEETWILQRYSRLSLYPKTEQNKDLRLLKVDDRHFQMKWPNESYLFSVGGDGLPACLCKAEFETEYGVCVATREDDGTGMIFTCNGAETTWNLHENNQMIWPNFNPALFPKSIESVNRANAVLNALPEKHFTEITFETKLLRNRVPVYNCPSDASREVDNAALFSNETFVYYGNDGVWCTIGYQDGIEHAYLGYIDINQLKLDKRERDITRNHFDAVTFVANRDTWLTDDPMLSQKWYAEIPLGTTLTGLSGWDASYIYAEVTIDGETIRGFAPIEDLALAE